MENKEITLTDVLRSINLECDYPEEQNIIDLFLDNPKSICISLFPCRINNADKINQVDVYYQKYLDHKIKKLDFLAEEKKFQELLKSLWICNDTFAFVVGSFDAITKSHYWKKSHKELVKSKLLIKKFSDSKSFLEIKSVNDLFALSTLSTREIATTIFFFKQHNAIIMLDGFCGILYMNNSSSLPKKIFNASSLYFWNRNTGDGSAG